jgi:hypothetical protein
LVIQKHLVIQANLGKHSNKGVDELVALNKKGVELIIR